MLEKLMHWLTYISIISFGVWYHQVYIADIAWFYIAPVVFVVISLLGIILYFHHLLWTERLRGKSTVSDEIKSANNSFYHKNKTRT